MKIVGIQRVDYISRKTNQPVTGVTLYLTEPRDQVEGLATDNAFISSKSPLFAQVIALPVGTEIKVLYNRWGNIDTIIPDIPEKK